MSEDEMLDYKLNSDEAGYVFLTHEMCQEYDFPLTTTAVNNLYEAMQLAKSHCETFHN